MKLKAAYIDHSYHKITRSTRFFMDFLSAYFEVDVYWDKSWNNGPSVDMAQIAGRNYDAIVFFQMIYPAYLIDVLNCHNIIYIPMYDNVYTMDDSFWYRFKDKVRFLCFSSSLHTRLLGLGLQSKYIQYFMPPYLEAEISDFTSLRGFFWQRQHDITWKEVRRLIKKSEFSRFYLHGAADPGFDFFSPSKKESKQYHITTSAWFQSKKDFSDVLRDSNVFFASRRYEGIGMSFIEAMSMGQCVVAPDSPTMNEYITHGETGLLYDINRIRPLDFSNAASMGRRAREYCEEGFLRWTNQKEELLEYIYPSYKKSRAKITRKNKTVVEAEERKRINVLYSSLQEQYDLSETMRRENQRLHSELKNTISSYSFRIGSMLLMPVKALIALSRKISDKLH